MWGQKSLFGMKIYLQQIKQSKKLIALDLGSHQTGVAISSDNLQNSYYLKCIQGNVISKKFSQNIANLIKGNGITGLLIGKVDSNNQRMRKITEDLLKSEALKKIQIPYTLVDESYTTYQTKIKLLNIEQMFRKWGHLHNQKELQDGLAAINIMNRFLAYYHLQ